MKKKREKNSKNIETETKVSGLSALLREKMEKTEPQTKPE